jgi:hypothetical protein
LEDENHGLKKLLVETVVDNAVLKDLLRETEIACGSRCGGEASDRGSRVSGASGLQVDRG